jgi:bacillithiol biosynthesis cysteine-adding enzyme BshC
MATECYPITTLPHITRLYRDFLAMAETPADSPLRQWYGSEPLGQRWMQSAAPNQHKSNQPAATQHANALADALTSQSLSFNAGPAALANIAKLRAGARAVVTGQQVGLFGGPLLTLLKASTAVARARQATSATGVDHVPIFWLATEDHDIEEVDQVSLLTKTAVDTLRIGHAPHATVPVGSVPIGPEIDALLERASELLGYAPVCDLLRACDAPTEHNPAPTFASAFACLMAALFADHGLIVMDAAGRNFHALGTRTLRTAIEQAPELEAALLARSAELESAGYHAQVLVKPGSSLLFLVSDLGGTPDRQPLRRMADGAWKAGAGTVAKTYTSADLLGILQSEPERLSPNALLRPVFQDTILPTTAYVGGPAEAAYFAQSDVLYRHILGRTTPILPRLSATLIEPEIAAVMSAHEISLGDVFQAKTVDELAQRLGARAMPIEGKRHLADAGNAMDDAIKRAEEYLGGMDAGLGRAAAVSGSKMRYQMNRLRRLAATFELQRQASLCKHADSLILHLYPEGHPQERVLAGAWFLAAWESTHGDRDGLIARLVEEAAGACPGHMVIRL